MSLSERRPIAILQSVACFKVHLQKIQGSAQQYISFLALLAEARKFLCFSL